MDTTFVSNANRGYKVQFNLDATVIDIDSNGDSPFIFEIDTDTIPAVGTSFDVKVALMIPGTTAIGPVATYSYLLTKPINVDNEYEVTDDDYVVLPFTYTGWNDVNALDGKATIRYNFQDSNSCDIDIDVPMTSSIDYSSGKFLPKILLSDITCKLDDLGITTQVRFLNIASTVSDSVTTDISAAYAVTVDFNEPESFDISFKHPVFDESNFANGVGFNVNLDDGVGGSAFFSNLYDRTTDSEVSYDSSSNKYTLTISYDDIVDSWHDQPYLSICGSTGYGSCYNEQITRVPDINVPTVVISSESDDLVISLTTGFTKEQMATSTYNVGIMIGSDEFLVKDLSVSGVTSTSGNVLDAIVPFSDDYIDSQGKISVSTYLVENDRVGELGDAVEVIILPAITIIESTIDNAKLEISVSYSSAWTGLFLTKHSRGYKVTFGNDNSEIEINIPDSPLVISTDLIPDVGSTFDVNVKPWIPTTTAEGPMVSKEFSLPKSVVDNSIGEVTALNELVIPFAMSGWDNLSELNDKAWVECIVGGISEVTGLSVEDKKIFTFDGSSVTYNGGIFTTRYPLNDITSHLDSLSVSVRPFFKHASTVVSDPLTGIDVSMAYDISIDQTTPDFMIIEFRHPRFVESSFVENSGFELSLDDGSSTIFFSNIFDRSSSPSKDVEYDSSTSKFKINIDYYLVDDDWLETSQLRICMVDGAVKSGTCSETEIVRIRDVLSSSISQLTNNNIEINVETWFGNKMKYNTYDVGLKIGSNYFSVKKDIMISGVDSDGSINKGVIHFDDAFIGDQIITVIPYLIVGDKVGRLFTPQTIDIAPKINNVSAKYTNGDLMLQFASVWSKDEVFDSYSRTWEIVLNNYLKYNLVADDVQPSEVIIDLDSLGHFTSDVNGPTSITVNSVFKSASASFNTPSDPVMLEISQPAIISSKIFKDNLEIHFNFADCTDLGVMNSDTKLLLNLESLDQQSSVDLDIPSSEWIISMETNSEWKVIIDLNDFVPQINKGQLNARAIIKHTQLKHSSVASEISQMEIVPPLFGIEYSADENGFIVDYENYLTKNAIANNVEYKFEFTFNGSTKSHICVDTLKCVISYENVAGLKSYYGSVDITLSVMFDGISNSETDQINFLPVYADELIIHQRSDNKLIADATTGWDINTILTTPNLEFVIEFWECLGSDPCSLKHTQKPSGSAAVDGKYVNQLITMDLVNPIVNDERVNAPKYEIRMRLEDGKPSSVSAGIIGSVQIIPAFVYSTILVTPSTGIVLNGSHPWIESSFDVLSHESDALSFKIEITATDDTRNMNIGDQIYERTYSLNEITSSVSGDVEFVINLDDIASSVKGIIEVKITPQTLSNTVFETLETETVDIRMCGDVNPVSPLILRSSTSNIPALDSEIVLSCEEGFQPLETSLFGRKCLETSTGWEWSNEIPECVVQKSSCSVSSQLPISMVATPEWEVGSSVPDGTTIVVDCESGFRLKGNNSRVCDDGIWINTVQSCIPENVTDSGKLCPAGTGVSRNGLRCMACQTAHREFSQNGVCKKCPIGWKPNSQRIDCIRL